MRRTLTLVTALWALFAAPPALADQRIDIVQRGQYRCEMPGNAAGSMAHPEPDKDFRIKSASRYSSPQGSGVYLYRGGVMEFTTGPRKGERYAVLREGFMRLLEADGSHGRLRCVRSQM